MDDYTCENCKSRNTWDCEDRGCNRICNEFRLDETTLNENERVMLRVMRQVIREQRGNNND